MGEFYTTDGCRAGKAVSLTGRLNKCGAASLRFDVHLKDLEKGQNDHQLPPGQLSCIVLTTPAGIKDHEEARRRHTGGKKSLDSFSVGVIHTNKVPQRGAGSHAASEGLRSGAIPPHAAGQERTGESRGGHQVALLPRGQRREPRAPGSEAAAPETRPPAQRSPGGPAGLCGPTSNRSIKTCAESLSQPLLSDISIVCSRMS